MLRYFYYSNFGGNSLELFCHSCALLSQRITEWIGYTNFRDDWFRDSLRQYRTRIAAQMRRRILRQTIQIEETRAAPLPKTKYDRIEASLCAAKALAGNYCAVLSSIRWGKNALSKSWRYLSNVFFEKEVVPRHLALRSFGVIPYLFLKDRQK